METFLLDKESKFILEIIGQLNKVPTKEISFKELTLKIGITKQTIKAYLDTLITYCEQHDLKTFTIENNKLKMSMGTSFNIFELYSHMVNRSVKYQIMSTILTNPEVTFTDLYLDLAVSKSNCSVHIKQLNNFLKAYHCKINLLQKNPIQGTEDQIRFLYYNLFWGLDLEMIIPDNARLDPIIKLLLEFSPHMTYSTLSKIRVAFYIFQIRCQNGHFITLKKDYIISNSPYIKYDTFFEKMDMLGVFKHCPDLATKHSECRYMYFLFCRINLITLGECKVSDIQITDFNSPDVQYLVTEFQKKSELDLTQNELKYLHYNLSLLNQEAAIFQGRCKVFGWEKIIKRFADTQENTYGFIKQFLSEICKKNRKIKKLITNLPTLYHHYGVLFKTIIEKHHQPIKLLVQSSVSSLYREELVTQIVTAIPSPVVVYTSEQLNGEKPDGIISDWIPEKKYQGVPFFSISLFYTNWHKGELDYFLNRLADKRNRL